MLSRRNIPEKIKKVERTNQRFSIRKLSIGAASVMIGLIFMGVNNNQQVDAATVQSPVLNTQTNSQNSNKENTESQQTIEETPTSLANSNKKQVASTDTQTSSTNAVPNTTSNQEVMKDPAVKGIGNESKGEQIGNITSKVSVEATNKYTNQSSSSSSNVVQVNEPVSDNLNMVITLNNNTDQVQQLNTSWPNNAYILPAYWGSKSAQIVVDGSRVKTDKTNGVIFGGNYVNSNVSIKSWDVAKENGSSGFNDSQANKDAIIKDPSLIGGFQIVGSLKANETVNIIVPIKAIDTQKTVSGTFQRQYGQSVNVQMSPEDFRDANQYTSASMTVDGLTDENISNLAETNGNLSVTGEITNTGFIDHEESMVLNWGNASNTDIHKVQTVLDTSKAINLDWDGTSSKDIQYLVNGSYKTASEMSTSDWNNVTGIKIQSKLNSGKTGKVLVPLKLANVDQIKYDLQKLSTLGTSSNRRNVINLSAQSDSNNIKVANGSITYYSELPAYSVMNAVKDEVDGKSSITPTYLVIDKDGNYNYVDAQNITIPHLDKDAFGYINVGHTQTSDTLFTDGVLTIQLDKIFNAIKDQGYSVNISDLNGQKAAWPTYYYNAGTGNENAKADLYVQLQKIFDTKDLTLDSGASWNSNDSLNSAQVEFYNLQGNAFAGSKFIGRTNLKETGNYTFDLYDANGNQIAKDVAVGQNVPTLAPGNYTVVYHYTINANEVVSKTAHITVNYPVIPDQPVTPTPNPENPDKPNTPDTPKPDDNNVAPKPHPTDKPDNGADNSVRPLPQTPENPSKNIQSSKNIAVNNHLSDHQAVVIKATKSTSQNSTVSHNSTVNEEKTLPQTGERKSNLGVIGLLLAGLGIFGLADRRRKNN